MIEQLIDRATGNPAVMASLIALSVFYLIKYALIWSGSGFKAMKLYEEKGNKNLTQLHSMVKSEFQTYKDDFYKLGELHGETVVIPTKFIEELKALPSDVLSFQDEMDEMFLTNHNLMSPRSIGGDPDTVINSVKNNLTRSLGAVMGDIYDEMIYAFNTEMPACDDWTEVNIMDKLVRIVALVSGRVFIGNPMNRNEDYLRCSIMFTLNVFQSVPIIRSYPRLLRWTAKYFSPEVKTIHESLATMKRLMKPLIEENTREIQQGTAPRNMNTWNMTNSPASQRDNVDIQAHMQLSISMAAIHTTSITTTHALYDLAARRDEYLGPLRDEVAAVKAGEPEAYMSKTSMPKLRKLDSFLRESQRMNPLSLINFRRKVIKDIRLHDGTLLPKGTHIAVMSSQITGDPTLWERPGEFDGFRFSNLREKPGNENRFQFVTTGQDNMQFGHGVHACPGRFFANNEIKLILIHILENYDIKFGEEQVGRPKNIYTPGGYAADRSVKLLMKRRAKA